MAYFPIQLGSNYNDCTVNGVLVAPIGQYVIDIFGNLIELKYNY